MAQLIVRNVNDRLAKRLKKKAAEDGISMEEEHRRILQKVLSSQDTSFKEMLLCVPEVGSDEDFERIPQSIREIEL